MKFEDFLLGSDFEDDHGGGEDPVNVSEALPDCTRYTYSSRIGLVMFSERNDEWIELVLVVWCS